VEGAFFFKWAMLFFLFSGKRVGQFEIIVVGQFMGSSPLLVKIEIYQLHEVLTPFFPLSRLL